MPAPSENVLYDRRRCPVRRLIPLPVPEDAEHRRLYVGMTGLQSERGDQRHIDWDHRTRLSPDRSPVALFQYTLRGSATFITAEGRWEITPGRGFLCPIPSPTRYFLPHDSRWEWIWLWLEGPLAVELARAHVRDFGYRLELPPTALPLQTAAQIYRAACGPPAKAGLLFTAVAYRFFLELREACRTGENLASVPLRYIEQRLGDPNLDASQTAEAMGLSRAYFTRCFRKDHGEPPHAYIVRRRLERARDLLRHSDLSVGQIAQACGFRHLPHFSTAFKRAYGVRPADERALDRGRALRS
jgi:AraC-like DNA-binding protein